MTTTKTTKPGALALDAMKSLATRVHGPAGSPEAADALADLGALIARCEQAEANVATAAEVERNLRDSCAALISEAATLRAQADALADALAETETELADARALLRRIGRDSVAQADDSNDVAIAARAAVAAYRAERGK